MDFSWIFVNNGISWNRTVEIFTFKEKPYPHNSQNVAHGEKLYGNSKDLEVNREIETLQIYTWLPILYCLGFTVSNTEDLISETTLPMCQG